MPLLKGKSNIGANLKELQSSGSKPRSYSQMLAIALSAAGESKKPGNRLKKAFRSKFKKDSNGDND